MVTLSTSSCLKGEQFSNNYNTYESSVFWYGYCNVERFMLMFPLVAFDVCEIRPKNKQMETA